MQAPHSRVSKRVTLVEVDKMTETRQDHFKFSTAILSRLGEELNPHPEQGIIELVRNSYDADAIECRIKFTKVNKKGGSIQIIDNGIGMDLGGISNGWLVLGRSSKSRRRRTKLGRRPVGDKGLGRLAALRMGKCVTLITRPQKEPLFEHKVIIDWGNFDRVSVIEDVTLDIETNATTKSGRFGTEILIEQLYSALSKKEIQRLARSLLLLADPFDNPTAFKPVLETAEYKSLQKILQNEYFSCAEYHLNAELTNNGLAKATIFDWKGKRLWSAKHEDIRKKKGHYDAPSTKFEFWAFNLGNKEFLPRTISMTDLKTWLKEVGGVHFYHRGLRVYPYGDQGHDWLNINLRRAQSPELRPSTNISIGRLCVVDPNNKLIQKTDRTGFIENNTFEELRAFAYDALEWMASCRLRKREEDRIIKRTKETHAFQKSRTELNKVIRKIPNESQQILKDVIKHYEDSRTKQVEVLREEVQLYRTLSTVGTTFAVFAHELKHPLNRIKMMTNAIEDYMGSSTTTGYTKFLKKPVKIIAKATKALIALPSLAMQLLERDRRQIKILPIHSEISEMLKTTEPFLQEMKIKAEKEFVDIEVHVYGSKASIQSILMNVTTNAMNAFIFNKDQKNKAKIIYRTLVSKDKLQINIIDSGPGIQGLSIDEIWLPGKTTTPNGTGLGLTIVRDTVTDLGGKVYAIAEGELGGAEIVIELPIAEEKP